MAWRLRSILRCSLLLALFLLPGRTWAGLITVRQDGSGDYLTIAGAIAAASASDTIEVGPGTYRESNQITVPLTLLGPAGPDSTTIDGEGIRRAFRVIGASGVRIAGFKILAGHANARGGALRVEAGATVSVEGCVFEGNASERDGGAVSLQDLGSELHLVDCSFLGNRSAMSGGAGYAAFGLITFTNCFFFQNSATQRSGAVATSSAGARITNCLFLENTSDEEAGAINLQVTSGLVKNNTFHGNTVTATTGRSATMVLGSYGGVNVTQNVFSGDPSGFGLIYATSGARNHSCNIFWDNAAGSILGDALDPSELEADPLFCVPATGNFSVALSSPAAPWNSPCDSLIGAFPPVCRQPVQVEITCIGDLSAFPCDSSITVPFEICNLVSTGDTMCIGWSFVATGSIAGLSGSGSGLVELLGGSCDSLRVQLDGTLAVPGDTSLVRFVVQAPCDTPVVFDTCYTLLTIAEPIFTLQCPETTVIEAGYDPIPMSFDLCDRSTSGEGHLYDYTIIASSDVAGLSGQKTGSLFVARGGCTSATMTLDGSQVVPGDTARVRMIVKSPCEPFSQTDTCETFLVVIGPEVSISCADTMFAGAFSGPIRLSFEVCDPNPEGISGCYSWSYLASSSVPGLSSSGGGSLTLGPGSCQEVTFQLDGSNAVEGDTALIRLIAETPCDSATISDTCYSILVMTSPCKDGGGNAFLFPDKDGTTVFVEAGRRQRILEGYGPANVTGLTDTFCVVVRATGSIGASYVLDRTWNCVELESGFYAPGTLEARVPCGVLPGDRDTLTIEQHYCARDACAGYCPPQDTDVIFVEVRPSAPGISVQCSNRVFAEAGVAFITVPFDVCNPDPCPDSLCFDYGYVATSSVLGLAGLGSGSASIRPPDCTRLIVPLRGSLAVAGDSSVIRLYAGTPCDSGVSFDTCITVLRIVEPAASVPIMGTPVTVILTVSLALLSVLGMRRRRIGAP